MKHAYLFPALAVLLAAAPAARAQQAWQPFRAGTIYQYSETATPGDTTHTLQVGPGAAVAGSPDTLYRFNRRAPKADVQRFQMGGSAYQLLADNLFGATLRVRPGAVFVLTAANGRTFTLRPRAPLGQNWAAGPAGLTAHVMSRSVAQVLGRPDSVVWFMLSDGQDIRLSQHFGLLEGPSLDSYLNGRNRRRGLVLTALSAPGRVVGSRVLGGLAAFDFQPGDVFQRHGTFLTSYGSVCSEDWTQDSVVSRTPSRTGDTVAYVFRVRALHRNYGQAGAPFGFCSATGSGYSATTENRLVTNIMGGSQPASALTNAFVSNGNTSIAFGNGDVSGPAVRSPRYYRRPEWEQQLCTLVASSTTDSARLRPVIDYGIRSSYVQGLGQTRRAQFSLGGQYDEQLVGYRKGAEIWGTFFSFRQLLAARAVRPAATTAAFPQPFDASLTVKFDLARPQPVALSLRDGLGRTVLTRPAAPLKAGSQQLDFDTQRLPGGVYTLHIGLLGEGRSEVLKVVKGE